MRRSTRVKTPSLKAVEALANKLEEEEQSENEDDYDTVEAGEPEEKYQEEVIDELERDQEEKDDVKRYMVELAKELHAPARRNYPTRMVLEYARDVTWSVDLADMSTWKKENNDYTYILVAVDIFSRYAFARALKSKSGKEVAVALEEIFNSSGRRPQKLWVDQGGEFKNKEVDKLRKKYDIVMYHTYGRGKSAIVERFNRTLKTDMMTMMTALNTHQWLSLLPVILDEYNNRPHSSLTVSLTPAQASKSEYTELVSEAWRQQMQKKKEGMYGRKEVGPLRPQYQVGDRVRISRLKGTFEKGYDKNWSNEVFTIKEIKMTDPVTYILIDDNGETIEGSFYDQELLKTQLEPKRLIEKVVQVDKKRKRALVKWLGLPESQNSWVTLSEIQNLKGMPERSERPERPEGGSQEVRFHE